MNLIYFILFATMFILGVWFYIFIEYKIDLYKNRKYNKRYPYEGSVLLKVSKNIIKNCK